MQAAYPKKYIFHALILLSLGIFIFLLFFNPIETDDVWWHLSMGKWMVEHWQVPHEDIFPLAHEKTPYLCTASSEWLGSVVLYLIVKAGGLLGLKVFRSLFFIFIIGILSFYSYKRLPFSFLVILAILMALGLADRGFLRPDIFNFFFIQIFLMVLFDHENSGNRKRLWILPVLSLIWFNMHLGSLFYGMSLLFIFLLSALINSKSQAQGLALTLLACLTSFLVNPYGIEGLLLPFKFILFPDLIDKFNRSMIAEQQAPGYILTSLNYFYFFILFGLGLLVIFLNKRNNFTLSVLLLFSLFAFLYMSRNSAFFTLVCVYVIVEGASQIKLNEAWQSLRYAKIVDCALFIGIALLLLVQISSLWNRESYYNGRLVHDRSLEVNPNSEGVIALLLKNKITGPVFNQDVLGGQMIWSGYPYLRPFLDGRSFNKERINNAMAILTDPEENWPKAERDYHLKIAVLNTAHHLQLSFIKYLGTQPAWQLIAVNGPFVIYVKKGEFYLPKELDGFEALLKSQDVSSVDRQNLKSLIERKNVPNLEGFLHPSVVYVDLFSRSLTLFRLGYKGAAIGDLVKALKISDKPDMQNAARYILKQFDIELAN